LQLACPVFGQHRRVFSCKPGDLGRIGHGRHLPDEHPWHYTELNRREFFIAGQLIQQPAQREAGRRSSAPGSLSRLPPVASGGLQIGTGRHPVGPISPAELMRSMIRNIGPPA